MRTSASAALAALSILGVAGVAGNAAAADLFRHHYRHHGYGHRLHAYRDDAACQTFEPTEYAPRTLNFRQPLCYAARPYGISQHLYDYSTLLRRTSGEDDVY